MICKIKEFRERKGMTQEELATISGISRYIISQLENNGNVNVTKKTMLAIAEALEAQVTEIFLF